jgi:hypothetical protein
MVDPTLDESDAAFVRNPQLAEPLVTTDSSTKTKLAGTAEKALEKTRSVAHSAIDSLDQGRKPAARILQNVAASMHDAAPRMPGGERVVRVVHSTAHGLNSTARYVRQHDVNRMGADLVRMIRVSPERSLLVALAAGFILGMAFSNHDDD